MSRLFQGSGRLALRQARHTLLAVFVLGTAFAVSQVYLDLQEEKARIEGIGPRVADSIYLSASSVAYRLDKVVALEILSGIVGSFGVVSAQIIDDFGDPVAIVVQPVSDSVTTSVASILVGNRGLSTTRELSVGHEAKSVGRLTIEVNPALAAQDFGARTLRVILSGFLKSLILALALFVIFHFTTTRRIRAIIDRFGSDDDLAGRSRDEIEYLSRKLTNWSERLSEEADELKRRDATVQVASQAAGIGYWEYDVDRNRLEWDAKMYDIFDLDPATVQNTYDKWRNRLVPEDLETSERALERTILRGEPLSIQFRIATSDGSHRHIKAAGARVIQNDGSLRIVGINYDVTDLERTLENLAAARKNAEAANVAKTNFLARMSHELRTPLNAIVGYSEFLQTLACRRLNKKEKDYLQAVVVSARNLSELVSDLLDLSKIEAGAMSIRVQPVQIAHTVDDVLSRFRIAAEKKGVHLATHPPQHPLTIYSDPLRVDQMLANLVSNAIKYTDEGGSVDVAWEMKGEASVRLSCTDTGHGIDSSRSVEIFEPFVQGPEHAYVAGGGAGIGLAVTKLLADRLGAPIDFKSEVGRGSCFWIDFPITSAGSVH